MHDQLVRVCPVCTRAFSGQEARCPDDGVALVTLETGGSGSMADLTGQLVDGRYKIEGVIGRGGMGMVYACRHVVVGKHLAMKVLKPGLERSEDVLARFIREAQAANAVRSPHIAESSDFGQLPSGHFYVVMELLEGLSLAAALKARALTRDQLLFVFSQMADTLAQTHEAGIVHRDLKPDNVYLVRDSNQPEHAPDGTPTQPLFVKLLDFGVAKLMNADDSNLTQSGVILGTPYYMAPEQARGQAIDHRADIYSLGVMMYHAFTGRLPFIADSAVAVLTAHAIDEPVRPSAVSTVDPGIEQLILRCMEKKPDARYGSMREIGEILRALRRSGGNFALPPSGAFPRIDTQSGASLSGPHSSIAGRMSGVSALPAAKSDSSGGKMLLAASLLMLTLGGGAAFFLFAHRQPKPLEPAVGASSSPATTSEIASSSSAPTASAASVPSASASAMTVASASASPSSSAISLSTPGNGAGHRDPRGNKGFVPPPPPPPVVTTSNPSSPNVSGDVRSPFK